VFPEKAVLPERSFFVAADAVPSGARLPLILLLFVLLIGLIIFALPSLNAQVNTATQSTTEGQCQNGGQSFNAQQEAYTLAQSAEQYRTTHSFGGNYGLGSYTICYKDGSQERFQSDPLPGNNNKTDKTKPKNYTHSEQAAYGWLQNTLAKLSIDQSRVPVIYTVIFSQVTVCVSCQQDMKLWQRTLREVAKSPSLALSIWDIAYGNGFNPATYPAGNGVPVTIDMLEAVRIEFVP
jgi:hypothetical protein